MKLALYLPNFRDEVTVKELEDLTGLAEELDFDSVWTLDRIVVPEASDRQELQYPFGMMQDFPKALPVSSRSTSTRLRKTRTTASSGGFRRDWRRRRTSRTGANNILHSPPTPRTAC